MSKSDAQPAMQHAMQDAEVVQVGVGVVIQPGKRVLIARRGTSGHLAGYWELPGGKCEPGESLQACVQRELREEVGLEVRVGRALTPVDYAYPERCVRLYAFLCQVIAGQAEAHVAQELRWVGVDALQAYRFPPANEPLIAELTRELAES